MRALLMDAEAREAIKQVITYAEAHRITTAELRRIADYPSLRPGNMASGFTCLIPNGYRCTLSIEEQPPESHLHGWCRHLSVSLTDGPPELMPSPAAVGVLAKEFGYTPTLVAALLQEPELIEALLSGQQGPTLKAAVWMEDIGKKHQAVNLLERC